MDSVGRLARQRWSLIALLLFVGAITVAGAAWAQEPDDPQVHLAHPGLLRRFAESHAIGTSAAVYDTVWVGLSNSNHYNAATNPENIWTGVYRPGAGLANGVGWDWDTFGFADGGAIDSLQGWLPVMWAANIRDFMGVDDQGQYPYACLDFGNYANAWVKSPNAKNRGIVGVWHADPGSGAGIGVTWTPISGAKSAWCGLREHGDNTQIDQVTGNPYNQNCLDFAKQTGIAGPTRKNFPGYAGQSDQMLYRDFNAVVGQPLTLSFNYRTRMSLLYHSATSGPGARRGWFNGDPLSTATGNFFSGSTVDIVDSFQVFIGVPVNDTAVTFSNGTSGVVLDPQRRWFSEVLRLFDGAAAPFYEMKSVAGTTPSLADTTGFNTFSRVVPDSLVQTIAASALNPTGKVRLVFRVKTNSLGDDLTGWGDELGGRGAAQVDDVTLAWGAGSPINFGDFELAEQGGDGAIDNRTSKTSEQNWKSTGRSIPLWFHARPLAGLPWADLCGVVEAPTRLCNMQGNVMDAGVDPTESIGIGTIDAFRSNYYGMISPTIDLSTATNPNNQGVPNDHASPTDDYLLRFDLYSGDLNAFAPVVGTGVLFWIGAMSYPNKTLNGTTCWGDICTGTEFYYQPDVFCSTPAYVKPLRATNTIFTSNASGAPDSLRLFIGIYNHPARFGSSIGANPTFGTYFDNVALGLINKSGGTGAVGDVSWWDWFADTFPHASFTGPGGGFSAISDLDTCGAYIKGARNIAQGALAGERLDILADSIKTAAGDRVKTSASDTNSVFIRCDLVFRILPGPGDYRQAAGDSVPRYPPITAQKLLRRPDVRTGGSALANPADAGDHSFWASYMRYPGQFASPGAHYGGTFWDYLSWNSARMDTVESNRFPIGGAPVTLQLGGFYQSTLHEQDPHFEEMGISKPRCFQIDTLNAANLNSDNIVCGAAPAWLTDPGGPPRSRTGWDGSVTTKEMTKIIPDGLLTPGSHVRVLHPQVAGVRVCRLHDDARYREHRPAVGGDADLDGHRWQEFSVLPDRYKAPEYKGAGDACLLFADYGDTGGGELVWVSVMDSIGGTAASKFGAHNGWHAAAGVDLSSASNPNLPAQAFVYNQNASPGTLWDMYGARFATQTWAGTRLGGRNTSRKGSDLLLGHDAVVAPSSFMLKSFYRTIALVTGLSSNALGPTPDMPEDDLATLADFLTSTDAVDPNSLPRMIYFSGAGLAVSESVDPVHAAFLAAYPGVTLVSPSYAELASNTRACADLTNTNVITPHADVYGVGLSCFYIQNVIGNVLGKSQNVSFYENTGHGPYVASVYHPAVASSGNDNYITLMDAFDLQNLWGRYCSTSYGRLARTYDVMTRVFSASCSKWTSPGPALNVPNAGNGAPFANFMKVGNSVMRAGSANVRFGIANTGRVRVRLYDVAGRLVRTLADKTFQGGQEYSALWDGRDDSGAQLARGVYFVRIDYAGGTAINGRVVVLR